MPTTTAAAAVGTVAAGTHRPALLEPALEPGNTGALASAHGAVDGVAAGREWYATHTRRVVQKERVSVSVRARHANAMVQRQDAVVTEPVGRSSAVAVAAETDSPADAVSNMPAAVV